MEKFIEDFLTDVKIEEDNFPKWCRIIVQQAHTYKNKLSEICMKEKRKPDWYELYLLTLAKFDIALYTKHTKGN